MPTFIHAHFHMSACCLAGIATLSVQVVCMDTNLHVCTNACFIAFTCSSLIMQNVKFWQYYKTLPYTALHYALYFTGG